jgi:hypothetical protein
MSGDEHDGDLKRGGDWSPEIVAAAAIIVAIALAAIGYEATYRTPSTTANAGSSAVTPSTFGQGGDRAKPSTDKQH